MIYTQTPGFGQPNVQGRVKTLCHPGFNPLVMPNTDDYNIIKKRSPMYDSTRKLYASCRKIDNKVVVDV